MKTHVVVKENGKWNLVSKMDATTYGNAGYEIITPTSILSSILKMGIPFGILITILVTTNKISNTDLRLGFTILILLRMLNLVKW